MSQPNKNSVGYTIKIAFLVCLACAVVVSTAAVALRDLQERNVVLDIKRNVLIAAGIFEPSRSIEEQFLDITTRVINLQTGEFVDHIDPETFENRTAARDPEMSRALSRQEDTAGLSRLENYSLVYFRGDENNFEQMILPVRGAGLWSTLHGFIALESDLNTIVGLGFYEHGETPGLGGEIDNPRWQAQWTGQRVFAESDSDKQEVALRVTRAGQADSSSPHEIDGLSGATLTARGVDNMVKFWMGDMGFAPFLRQMKARQAEPDLAAVTVEGI